MTLTDPDVLVLLAVRLAGRGTAARVEEIAHHLGHRGRVATGLAAAAELGHVRRRGQEGRYSLTAAGDAELSGLLARETDAVGRADLVVAYEAFLPLNREFLATLQAGGDVRLDALAALVRDLEPILRSLAAQLPRFSRYPDRFAHAIREAATDAAWLQSPRVDSIHTVWFELHEHLLATLGRDRTHER